MFKQKLHLPLLAFSTVALVTDFVCAKDFGLGESKDALKLKNDVQVKGHRQDVALALTQWYDFVSELCVNRFE